MLTAFLSITAATVSAVLVALAVQRQQSLLDPDRGHWSERGPVLGGAETTVHAWNRFHVRYYPMILVFIAFEMEMMFMYPWAVVFVQEGVKALVEMGMFLTILSVGIAYAWREGALGWQ
ncbi:MAG: NADH-quinone oxidoreductase subunit A [Euzebya sp.]